MDFKEISNQKIVSELIKLTKDLKIFDSYKVNNLSGYIQVRLESKKDNAYVEFLFDSNSEVYSLESSFSFEDLYKIKYFRKYFNQDEYESGNLN